MRARSAQSDRLIAKGRYVVRGGPFIGPRGGKWADPAHTRPWRPSDALAIRSDGEPEDASPRRSQPNRLQIATGRTPLGPVHPSMNLPQVRRAIATQPVEYLVAFDEAGRQVVRATENRRGSIGAPDALTRHLRDRFWTHNHPNGSCPSPGDILVAISSDSLGFEAVTHPKATSRPTRYVIQRPQNGWGRLSEDVLDVFVHLDELRSATVNELAWTSDDELPPLARASLNAVLVSKYDAYLRSLSGGDVRILSRA